MCQNKSGGAIAALMETRSTQKTHNLKGTVLPSGSTAKGNKSCYLWQTGTRGGTANLAPVGRGKVKQTRQTSRAIRNMIRKMMKCDQLVKGIIINFDIY